MSRGKGEGSVYQDKAGQWHAAFDYGEVGGKRVRKRRNARNKSHAAKLLNEMRNEAAAMAIDTGKAPSVAAWLNTWLDICERKNAEQTVIGYRQYVRIWLAPQLGRIRLDALTVTHVEALYAHMRAAGKSSGTIHTAHRHLRAALNLALKRGLIRVNPAVLAEPGRLETPEFEPLSAEEAGRVLTATAGRRNGPRWSVALALGLRQGESLGLTWADIDLDTAQLWVRRAIHRNVWQHGCRDPKRCAYRNSKGTVVPAKRGADCPQRVGGGFRLADPKTAMSRRPLALSERMVESLRAHKAAQGAERLAAGSMWQGAPVGGGLVFATRTGTPIPRKVDWIDWRDLLVEAKVPHHRVHDARVTAATLALQQGLSEQIVMQMFGWSTVAMLRRYQKFVDPIARAAAQAMDAALYPATEPSAPKKQRRSKAS